MTTLPSVKNEVVQCKVNANVPLPEKPITPGDELSACLLPESKIKCEVRIVFLFLLSAWHNEEVHSDSTLYFKTLKIKFKSKLKIIDSIYMRLPLDDVGLSLSRGLSNFLD